MADYALMNQLLFEGQHESVRRMIEDALAEGRPAMEVLEEGLIEIGRASCRERVSTIV